MSSTASAPNAMSKAAFSIISVEFTGIIISRNESRTIRGRVLSSGHGLVIDSNELALLDKEGPEYGTFASFMGRPIEML